MNVILKAFGQWLYSFPVWAASWVVVPVALLMCSKDDDHLPRWAWWFDEPTYGINGDPYWRGPDHANGHEREFLWRLRWLIRNSLGGWSHSVMGFHYSRIRAIKWSGDVATANRPVGHSGTLDITVTLDDGSERECLYIVRQWGSSGRCFRFYCGYKLKDVLDYYLRVGKLPGERDAYVQDVFSPNPLMGYVNANR
ncbi:MAG: hypothetical protein KKH74_06485 [Gammaproteobacteria bacterium]|nr:hypothetical protein [Gammaproteobacteria bacterium]MBU1732290.1 hypothetical protein [Gammaproteobacteria bacterium]MBU1893860.1 hypothetical protein [Gammaproteobacteria bacterium]